ncbi:MAG: indole-3-glycerol-phosphate synthase [Conexivisphaerales archaeon]
MGVDYLELLVKRAKRRVAEGYYDLPADSYPKRSLRDSIDRATGNAIIAEVKPSSPSEGRIVSKFDLKQLLEEYERGGAIGISILTEPDSFGGDIARLSLARRYCSLPLLMKDIVVSPAQIKAAKYAGADAVLLIASVFEDKKDLSTMIELVHEEGLEVLLETHTELEFMQAMDSESDMVGINNRNMMSLKVDIELSKRLLRLKKRSKPVICESGISSAEQIAELKSYGADAFLVGTALMKADTPSSLLRSMILA